jgi:hypothetical protein
MAYIGNDLQVANTSYKVVDDISSGFNGSTKTFAFQVNGVAPVPFPINPQQCLISVNGILLKPDITGAVGFTFSGTNIVFASAPSGGATFFGVILAGADYVNAGVDFPDGTSVAPSVTFLNSTGTGLYLISGNTLGVTTGGTKRLTFDPSGNVLVSNFGALGYGPGAGSSVTQSTSKSTSVTLNTPSGQIVMNAAALLSNDSVNFTLNNSLISATDTLIVNQSTSGGTTNGYIIRCLTCGAGTATIRVSNITGGSLSEAVVINFAVLKASIT